MKNIDPLVQMSELCKITGLSRSTVYRMIDDGRICAPAKIGDGPKSRVVWRESVVREFLDKLMPSADV